MVVRLLAVSDVAPRHSLVTTPLATSCRLVARRGSEEEKDKEIALTTLYWLNGAPTEKCNEYLTESSRGKMGSPLIKESLTFFNCNDRESSGDKSS
uniref:Uncharacterized protein n=1 Tax=Tanacetum cinerariifolium TaxID=118510 RepID=A0A6L2LS14_TANCI|nr:hypothetical protein [Tanacetum cinerariifolium]